MPVLQANDDSIALAAGLLRDGRPVAFPTETVYGLGADTFCERAIDRVYRLKGREADNPLIAHVLDVTQARRVTASWDDRCERLARRFWPGPLTLVAARSADVPERSTAGWPTIAVRAPSHPVVRALLAAFNGPVSAASANRSGHVSPTSARHVADDYTQEEELVILDGGPSEIGIESTVVDLTGDVAAVLRPGVVTFDELREVIGDVAAGQTATQGPSPGTSARHYAPHTPTELIAGEALPSRLKAGEVPAVVLCFETTTVPAPHRAMVMPAEPEPYAARLYDALREADRAGCVRIFIEQPPSRDGLWMAILDRLSRATTRD